MDTKDYILFEDEFDNDELPGGHRINTRRQDAPVARKMAEEANRFRRPKPTPEPIFGSHTNPPARKRQSTNAGQEPG